MNGPSWPRVRGVALKVLGAVVALEAAYFVGANGFFASKALESIISSKDGTLQLHYRNLWSPFPGRYHVTGLTVARRGESAQIRLVVPDAWFTSNPLTLVQKRFAVTRVRGEGISFRLRVPPTLEEIGTLQALAQPPIPEFDATFWPPVPLVIDPPSERWTVDIRGVDVVAKELWFDRIRYLGDAFARGGFTLTPSGSFRIHPSSLEVKSGSLEVGSETAASAVEGDLAGHIETMPLPITDNAMDIFRRLHAHAFLNAAVADTAFLGAYLLPGLATSGGSGAAAADVTVASGTFVEGSRATYETLSADVAFELAEHRVGVTGPIIAEWKAELGESFLATLFPRTSFRRDGFDDASPVATDVAITVASGNPDLAIPWAFGGASAAIGSIDAPDVRFFNLRPVAAKGIAFDRGSAKARGSLAMRPDFATSGDLQLTAAGLDGRYGDNAIHAEVALTARAAPSQLASGVSLESSRLDLRDVALRQGKKGIASNWWARFDAGPSKIGFAPSASFSGPVHLRALDASPILTLALENTAVPTWLRDHLRTDNLSVQTAVSASRGRFDLNIPEAAGGPFGMVGHLRIDPRDHTCGAFLFTQRGETESKSLLTLGIAVKESGTELKPTADRAWLDERIKELALRSTTLCVTPPSR